MKDLQQAGVQFSAVHRFGHVGPENALLPTSVIAQFAEGRDHYQRGVVQLWTGDDGGP